MAWGGGRDAPPLPQFPPAGATGPCASSRSWEAIPVLVGVTRELAGSCEPASQEQHVREQNQPCEDVFAPGEMLDQPCQRPALVCYCPVLPKNAPFPSKERWDLGEGGCGA